MIERFTETARGAVAMSQEEARSIEQPYIGSEHLLLGVIRGGGRSARILGELGVTLEDAREKVRDLSPPSSKNAEGQIPFSPSGRQCLELAFREALSLKHNYIGAQHLLRAVIREGGAGRGILERL